MGESWRSGDIVDESCCMHPDRLKYLLDKFLTKTASPEEAEEYDAWFERTIQEGEDLFEPDAEQLKEYKAKLLSEICDEIERKEAFILNRKTKRRRVSWVAAASVMVAIVSVLYYSFGTGTGVTQNELLAEGQQDEQPVLNVKLETISSPVGSKQTVYLEDSSMVILFPDSEISFRKPFGLDKREIHLKGKAEFSVVKDSSRPFTVYTRAISTTALGTSFTITAYLNDFVEVVLHTGKVVVKQIEGEHRMKDIYLNPLQWVTYDIATGKTKSGTQSAPIAKTNKKPRSFASLTGFAATFKEEPLLNVLDTIKKAYSVQLDFDSRLVENKIFTGIIKESDTLLQVLNRIAILNSMILTETKKGYRFQ